MWTVLFSVCESTRISGHTVQASFFLVLSLVLLTCCVSSSLALFIQRHTLVHRGFMRSGFSHKHWVTRSADLSVANLIYILHTFRLMTHWFFVLFHLHREANIQINVQHSVEETADTWKISGWVLRGRSLCDGMMRRWKGQSPWLPTRPSWHSELEEVDSRSLKAQREEQSVDEKLRSSPWRRVGSRTTCCQWSARRPAAGWELALRTASVACLLGHKHTKQEMYISWRPAGEQRMHVTPRKFRMKEQKRIPFYLLIFTSYVLMTLTEFDVRKNQTLRFTLIMWLIQ